MLVQDLASDSPSLSHPFGHWAEPGWFLWLISSRLISLCLGTWNPCLLGNNREFWTGMYCFKYRKLIVCRKAMGEWGLVFSLGRNTWAALLCSHPWTRTVGVCFSSLSLFCILLYFILFYFILFYSILFQFWQGVKCSDSPTPLASASGHEWATGFLGARLIQLGMFQNPPVPSGKWSCHQPRVSPA